jgi:4,5:9,10-diseco-3-hydroxy-5,9,17-trioxoandrosta-1(10),2-diene-4-oate hydrolase
MVTLPPQDCYVRVGSINTRYRVAGDAGTSVVLIHGIGSSLEDWDYNFGPLAEHHRVYALDLVGNGRTDKPAAPYSMSYFGDFLHDFLQTLGVKRANLVGNSMGGAVALEIAIRFPAMVERLVLVDPAGLGRGVTLFFRLPTLPIIGERLTKPSLKGSEQLARAVFFDQSFITPDLLQFSYERSCLPGAQDAMLKTLRTNVNLLGVKPAVVRHLTGSLARVTAPTLVVWGREDQIVEAGLAEVARRGIPNVTVRIFERCGHAPMMEQAAEFNSLVLAFLQ